MNKFVETAKGVGGFLFGAYLFSVFAVMTPYYNWQYAKDHGFVAWVILGQIVPTAKAAVWPYFVFLADRQPSPSAAESKTIFEYTDNQYGYAFQYPSDWKIQPKPAPGEAGEVRVIIRSATKKMSQVMTLVGHLETTAPTREQFEKSPNREAVVNMMIDFTIEQVYKKASRSIGAESIIVTERRALPSEVGVKFYIAAGNVVAGKVFIGTAGIHIIPFGKDYMVTFLMTTAVDPKATEENETITNVFNSFHLAGERPR